LSEIRHILFKLSHVNGVIESLLVVLKTKSDVVLYGGRENKGLLLNIGNFTAD
jgi:hypothetical protein